MRERQATPLGAHTTYPMQNLILPEMSRMSACMCL